jgi:hypothetical protein
MKWSILGATLLIVAALPSRADSIIFSTVAYQDFGAASVTLGPGLDPLLAPTVTSSGIEYLLFGTHLGEAVYSRTLLVQGAQHILGPFGIDCDLRRWGLKLAQRGGRNGKKRAIVGTARKLAVLLHHLWVSGEVYEPLHNSSRTTVAAAA